MHLKNANVRLVKLPASIDLILFLIQEDLKTTRLFNSLSDVGLSDSFYQSHFATVVLASVGFRERPDDLYEFYLALIDRRSKKIKPNHDSVVRQAFKVYIELIIERKNRAHRKG